MAHPELGRKVLDDVVAAVGQHAKVDNSARMEGRSMSMVLSPDKKAIDAIKKAETSKTETSKTETKKSEAPPAVAQTVPDDQPAEADVTAAPDEALAGQPAGIEAIEASVEGAATPEQAGEQ